MFKGFITSFNLEETLISNLDEYLMNNLQPHYFPHVQEKFNNRAVENAINLSHSFKWFMNNNSLINMYDIFNELIIDSLKTTNKIIWKDFIVYVTKIIDNVPYLLGVHLSKKDTILQRLIDLYISYEINYEKLNDFQKNNHNIIWILIQNVWRLQFKHQYLNHNGFCLISYQDMKYKSYSNVDDERIDMIMKTIDNQQYIFYITYKIKTKFNVNNIISISQKPPVPVVNSVVNQQVIALQEHNNEEDSQHEDDRETLLATHGTQSLHVTFEEGEKDEDHLLETLSQSTDGRQISGDTYTSDSDPNTPLLGYDNDTDRTYPVIRNKSNAEDEAFMAKQLLNTFIHSTKQTMSDPNQKEEEEEEEEEEEDLHEEEDEEV